MCFTLQRYKIESNSQHLYLRLSVYFRCVSHCKDTKLKAIHNSLVCFPLFLFVVFHTAKIQNWKQFTTTVKFVLYRQMLCFTLQRYKIESNSQHVTMPSDDKICCVSHCKDTKLKAIHNFVRYFYFFWLVVFHTAKIQNWKQFTTNLRKLKHLYQLCFTLQRYKIESNSQPINNNIIIINSCVLHCKDTKLKAIHNATFYVATIKLVVFYTAKIQNWKQFTTWTSI